MCPSLIPPRALGSIVGSGVSTESLVSGLSLKGCKAKSADRPNQTISLPSSPDPEVFNVSLKNVQSYSLFQSYNDICVQMLQRLAN